MFRIFLSILFTTCILAAPAPPLLNQPWIKLKEDKTLQRFHSTLLNETFLPFLSECYTEHPTKLSNAKSQTAESICSRYFDGVLQLNHTDYVVSIPKVIEIRDQVDGTVAFCDQKHIFPVPKYFRNAPQRDFSNLAICGHVCLNDDLTSKQSCRLLAWLGEEIQEKSAENNKAAAVTPSVLVTPPSVPAVAAADAAAVAGPLPAASAVAAPTKVSQAVQLKSEEKEVPVYQKEKKPEADKPDDATTAEKPIPISSSNDKLVVQKPKTPIAVVEAPIITNAKEKNDKLPLPAPTKVAPAAQNIPANVPEIPKNDEPIDTKPVQPADEEADTAGTPVNTSAQDGGAAAPAGDDVQIIPPKNKHDSMETGDSEEDVNSIGDDTGIESEDYKEMTNGKANNENGIPKIDDNDHNQSSSPEIIVNNDIVNNKPVVDPFLEESGSNFFTYFLIGMFLCIAMYVLYHNKSKVLALLLEGRRGDKGRGGRRKHTAAYRKLDSNLEEAITSSASGRTTQIIY